ncbi:MAG: Sporulation kinase [Planctomycetota bacterium]|jgi:signal transduction histidine kinase
MSNESLGNYSEENARLLVQYQELAELAGALAHEIKNPLSVIRMNMDLLEEDFAKSESARDRRVLQKIGIVSRQCTRLENLLNDFLKFTRLRELELRPGNLNEQIERVLELYEGALRDNPIVISRFYDAHLPAIMMHPETLQAALVNLVKNAIEAMPNGGKLVVITQGTRSGVALEMIDSGCGMDENTLFRMFEPFYSTKNNGTGLGLPTSKKIIEAHGGTIDVQSVVGLGTKFRLEFPAPARIEQGDRAPESTASSASSPQSLAVQELTQPASTQTESAHPDDLPLPESVSPDRSDSKKADP